MEFSCLDDGQDIGDALAALTRRRANFSCYAKICIIARTPCLQGMTLERRTGRQWPKTSISLHAISGWSLTLRSYVPMLTQSKKPRKQDSRIEKRPIHG